MPHKSIKHILNQLFDIKPMMHSGDLHWDKIYSVKKCLNLKSIEKENIFQKKQKIDIHSSRLRQSSGRLPDGRFAQEALAPILINYYQPHNKNSYELINQPLQKNENILKNSSPAPSEREKILMELERILS